MKFIASIISLFCLTGCISIIDVSSHKHFQNIIGKKVVLKEAQKLCLRRDNDNFRVVREIGLLEPKEYCDLKRIAWLPIGTVLAIESVKQQSIPSAGRSWVALGSTYINGQTYKFEYHYGVFDINRAPWEGEAIPLKRKMN